MGQSTYDINWTLMKAFHHRCVIGSLCFRCLLGQWDTFSLKQRALVSWKMGWTLMPYKVFLILQQTDTKLCPFSFCVQFIMFNATIEFWHNHIILVSELSRKGSIQLIFNCMWSCWVTFFFYIAYHDMVKYSINVYCYKWILFFCASL